jgi:hypothetical protein
VLHLKSCPDRLITLRRGVRSQNEKRRKGEKEKRRKGEKESFHISTSTGASSMQPFIEKSSGRAEV